MLSVKYSFFFYVCLTTMQITVDSLVIEEAVAKINAVDDRSSLANKRNVKPKVNKSDSKISTKDLQTYKPSQLPAHSKNIKSDRKTNKTITIDDKVPNTDKKPKSDLVKYGKDNINILFKTYRNINCVFGAWTSDELIRFVEGFPLLYHTKLQLIDNNQFSEEFDELVRVLDSILKNTTLFFNILLNFSNIYKYDLYFETDISKSLLSLNFKIMFIKESKSKDHIVVRLILEVINSIQYFMSLYCTHIPHKLKKNTFYGFLEYGNFFKTTRIDEFLSNIELLGLKPSNCDHQKLFLILELIPGYETIEWATDANSDYTHVPVKKIMETIGTSHDLENILWYKKNEFNTVMKLLFSKLYKYLETNAQVTDEILKGFAEIYSYVSVRYTNLPFELEECFELLRSNQKNGNAQRDVLRQAITDLVVSMSDINCTQSPISDYTLEQFIPVMTNVYHGGFGCSLDLLDFLQNENNKYFSPHRIRSRPVESKTVDADEAKLDDEGCNCFGNLYRYCFEIVITLNSAYGTKIAAEKDPIYRLADDLLQRAKRFLFDLTRHYYHYDHFETALGAAAVVVFLEKHYCNDSNYGPIRKGLFAVMLELNKYGLRFCVPPDHNFLFFNNIDANAVGQLDRVEAAIGASIGRLKSLRRTTADYGFPDTFGRIFDKNASYLESYNDIITVNYDGERKSYGRIFRDVNSLPARSASVYYGYYDVLHKLSVGVIFYELRTISEAFSYVMSPKDSGEFEFVLKNFGDDIRCFPLAYKNIVTDLHHYGKSVLSGHRKKYNNERTASEDNEKIVRHARIVNRLKKFGVFIDFDKGLQSAKSYTFLLDKIKNISLTVTNVRNAYESYSFDRLQLN